MQKFILRFGLLVLGLPLFGWSTELNSSIFFFRNGDIENCAPHIDRAKGIGNAKVQFVYTFFFTGGDPWQQSFDHFCYDRNGCERLTEEFTQAIHAGIKQCIQYAFDQGLDVSFLGHIDFTGPGEYWRNQLAFDPKKFYGETSYYENHLKPLATAISELRDQGRSLEWTLVGEMGATVFHYADRYREILREFRMLFQGRKVLMGVGFNHNRIGGDNFQYSEAQLSAVEELLKESDFMGISAYTWLDDAVLSPASFYKNVTRLKGELTNYGIELEPEKDIHFSEVSIGGYKSTNAGYVIAEEPWEIFGSPWAGTGGDYDIARDPWQKPRLQAARKEFHVQLLKLLADPGQFAHKVTGAFVWNLASWDVQGFNAPEYGDPEVQEMIRAHNALH